jgi:membrane protein YdbS with pleckstrin-like domain
MAEFLETLQQNSRTFIVALIVVVVLAIVLVYIAPKYKKDGFKLKSVRSDWDIEEAVQKLEHIQSQN